jgi:hypothetical protein
MKCHEEFEQIEFALKNSPLYDARWYPVSPDKLVRLISTHQPQIVHFGVHGVRFGAEAKAAGRDYRPPASVIQSELSEPGLVFVGEDGEPAVVPASHLEAVFAGFASHIQCVVLNACFSNELAVRLARHIDHVIGMGRAIEDDAAIAFAGQFYTSLVNGASFKDAVAQASSHLPVARHPDCDVHLEHRDGVDKNATPAAPMRPHPDDDNTVPIGRSWTLVAIAMSLIAVGIMYIGLGPEPVEPTAQPISGGPTPTEPSTGGNSAASDKPAAGATPDAATPHQKRDTSLPPHAAVNRLRQFIRDRRCRPNLQQVDGRWYVTCVCDASVARVHEDVFVGRVEAGGAPPVDAAVAQALFQKWSCP